MLHEGKSFVFFATQGFMGKHSDMRTSLYGGSWGGGRLPCPVVHKTKVQGLKLAWRPHGERVLHSRLSQACSG